MFTARIAGGLAVAGAATLALPAGATAAPPAPTYSKPIRAYTTGAVARPASRVRCKTYVNGRSYVDRTRRKRLFTVYLRSRWCFDGKRVRRLGRQQLLYRITDWGRDVGYRWGGEVRDQRVDRVFSLRGVSRRAGYDVYRVAKMEWAPQGVTFRSYEIPQGHFLYFDGHADAMEDPKPPDS